ncbi:Protein EMSY-LIKE 1 [Cardamine amara subsp. amara]|uniref:Protein EMSY-LIKE 1 n=1 Tax=Cardamine amara subsp. amara TaxID=228776 RepID=A0ABD1BD64_CARAN
MANQNDQGTNPPAEDPTFLPLKKRAMAEKSLVGSSRAPESDSSDSSGDSSSDDEDELMDLSGNESRQPDLEELQEKAYYSVLRAFTTETSTISDKRTRIIERLMNEWKIANETHVSFADKIQKDLVMYIYPITKAFYLEDLISPLPCLKFHLCLLREDEKEMQIAQEKPLTKPATWSSPIVPKPRASWGNVNPESLLGTYVSIKKPDEAQFEEFIIKAYDAEQDMHRLETTNSNAMETDEMIDLREIPSALIMWETGKKPDFDAPKLPTRRTLF